MMSLNPLATPKGVRLLCELCKKPAYLQCTKCRVTYYCGEQHCDEDWEAIHNQICPILAVLRAPLPHANSEEEREHRKHQQTLRRKHVVEVALREGRLFLHKGHYGLAIPAALAALTLLTELHGAAHIQLTPAYLLLAEAAIGLGRLSEADQYLSQAQWSVLRTPDCEAWLKARLHRNLGLLAAAKGQLAEAHRHFAEDIFQSSVAHSPHAIQTAGGYFHLGRVFLSEAKPDIAFSLHNKVVSVWRERLDFIVQAMANAPPLTKQLSPSHAQPPTPVPTLETADRAEASSMLHNICELRERHTHASSSLLGPVYQTLALLYCVLRDSAKSSEYAGKALALKKVSSADKESMEQLLELLPRLQQNT